MSTSRRTFLKSAAAIGAGLYVGRPSASWASKSPSEKIDVACVGVGNRGYSNVQGVKSQNIVAMCDVDDVTAAKAYKNFPKATKYRDFREMLDNEKLDGVVVATPDHTHLPVAITAMRRDLPVYVEKPMGHNVWEVRLATELAREKNLATQLGTQIHATDNYRRVVEAVQSGAIGPIRDVQVWIHKDWGGDHDKRLKGTPPIPETLDWDLWLGPAEERPYAKGYLPREWRRWWEFGCGTLGDMGCHYMDLAYWAMGLDYPTKIAAEGPKPSPECPPHGMKVIYNFPSKGDRPPLQMTWSDGNMAPTELHGIKLPGAGVLFVGEEGQILGTYSSLKLYPEEKYADWTAPEPTIPPSIGHHNEWIAAVKTGSPTLCNFDYSGPLTETVLLGCAAYRAGQPLEWDAANLKVTNDVPGAAELIHPAYRKGWELG